ncbi:MAG: DUF2029 domain-containing protein [Planctomycetes bacterium]|nr:DUF2029 domain-containing protein [Planctomycetota bacterium]
MIAHSFLDSLERRPVRRVITAILLVLLLLGWAVAVRRALRGSSEFTGFSRISDTTILRGLDLYEAVKHRRAYPPFFAVFFLPFTVIGKVAGAILFSGVNLLSLVASPWLCLRAALARRPRLSEWLLLFLLGAPLMGNVLLRSETDLVILLAVSGALWLLSVRGLPALAGAALSLAAAIKVLPAYLALWLVARREWRALAAMVVGGVVLVGGLGSVAFGPVHNLDHHVRYHQEIVLPYREGGADALIERPWRTNNQSLMAAAYRYLAPAEVTEKNVYDFVQVARLPAESVRRVVKILVLLLSALLFLLWFRMGARETPVARTAGLGTALIGMLEMSEMSGTGHHALLVVPLSAALAFALDLTRSGSDRRIVAWGTAAAMLLIWSCAVDYLKGLSFLLFGTLVLLGVTVFILLCERSGRRAESGRPGVETGPATGC